MNTIAKQAILAASLIASMASHAQTPLNNKDLLSFAAEFYSTCFPATQQNREWLQLSRVTAQNYCKCMAVELAVTVTYEELIRIHQTKDNSMLHIRSGRNMEKCAAAAVSGSSRAM